MEKHGNGNQHDGKKPNFLTRLTATCSAPLTQVALFALSTWLIVLGLKGLAGFTINQVTAFSDLLGIAIVIGAARWLKTRSASNK